MTEPKGTNWGEVGTTVGICLIVVAICLVAIPQSREWFASKFNAEK